MYLVYVRCNFFRTPINKRFKCLQTILPQFIIIFITVLNDQRHNAFYLFTESVTRLPTAINLQKLYG